MLRRFGFAFLVVVLLLALLPATLGAASGAPQVSLTLGSGTIAVGQTTSLTVTVSGGADVYGASVDLVVNPALIQVTAVSADGMVNSGLPANQYFTATPTATLSPTAERHSAISIRLGALSGATGDGKIAVFTLKALAAGTIPFSVDGTTVAVQMVDSQGSPIAFTATQSATLVVGTSVITDPPNNSFVNSQTVTFTGTGTPGSTLVPTVDGVELSAVISVLGDGSFTYTKTFAADGTHTVKVCVQASTTCSPLISIVVDTVLPVLNVDPIAAAAATTVSGTVSDTNFDALYIQVNPTDLTNLGSPVPVTGGAFSKSVSLTQPVGTPNTVRVVARDRAGNEQVVTRSVTVPDTRPYLHLVPRSTTVGPGATVLVDVILENLPANVYGVQFELTYPTESLQAVSVTETGNLFTGSELAPFKYIDKKPDGTVNPGTIEWAQSTTLAPVPGVNLVATINFTVKPVTGNAVAHIQFADLYADTGGDGVALYDAAGGDITTANPQNADLNIVVGGTVSGKAKLWGRPETRTGRTGYTGYAGITVDVVNPSTGVSVATTTTTTSDGVFTITNVPAGTYTVKFSRGQFLSFAIQNVPVINATVTSLSHLNASLRPGNMVDNVVSRDRIAGEDLTCLAQAWGAPLGGPKWNAAADLNDDLLINGGDLTLLAQAWGKKGSTVTGSDQVLTYTPAP